MTTSTFRTFGLPALIVAVLLAATTWVYLPGLGGQLIFDDYPNLMPWETLGDIDSWRETLTFVFSGNGTPGRPLSLLTFLMDDQSWSPDIYSLKRTNLAIHLINSLLVLWLCTKLIQRLLPGASAMRQMLLAGLASAIWALHPLQVSNVAYIIQRMNLLSTLLELAGLLLFIHGRAVLATQPVRALVLCSLGIGFFMPAAILAKENGLLLCAFALLVDRYCFEPDRSKVYRLWKAVFLWLPLLAVLAYALKQNDFFLHKLAVRNFTHWERLLTQGPVIQDYLSKLLIPRMSGSTLFYENFPVSRSLFQPWNTATSWLLLLALLGTAWGIRHRLPLASFGLFFYFVGHLMESTLLPLELYFEHRNYLPQLGLWLVLAALLNLADSRRLQIALIASFGVLVLLLAILTRNNAALWSNSDLQVAMWYHENPGSLRSTQAYANVLLKQGRMDDVHKVLQDGIQRMPKSLALTISDRYVSCYLEDRKTSFAGLADFARTADYDLSSVIMLERMRKYEASPLRELSNCTLISARDVAQIYQAMLANPSFGIPSIHSRLYEYLGEIAVSQGSLDEAMDYYDRAFVESPNPIYPYRQATLLESAGLYAEALPFLDKAAAALTLRKQLVYPDLELRISELRAILTKQGN